MRLKSLRRFVRIALVWTIVLLMSIDTSMACHWYFTPGARCCVPAPCYTAVIEYPATANCYVPVEAHHVPRHVTSEDSPGSTIPEAPIADHQDDATEAPDKDPMPVELASPEAEPMELPVPDPSLDEEFVADDATDPVEVPSVAIPVEVPGTPMPEEKTATEVDDLFGEPEEPLSDASEPVEAPETPMPEREADMEVDDLFGEPDEPLLVPEEEPAELDETFDGDSAAEKLTEELDDLFGGNADDEAALAEEESADEDKLMVDTVEEDGEAADEIGIEDLFDGGEEEGVDEDEKSIEDLFNQDQKRWTEPIVETNIESTPTSPLMVVRDTPEPLLPSPPAHHTLPAAMVVAKTSQSVSSSPGHAISSAPPLPAMAIGEIPKLTAPLAVRITSTPIPAVKAFVRPARAALTMRTWVDNTGLYSTHGRLIEAREDAVRLLKDNGRHSTVPMRRLSHMDRAYVLQIASQLDDDGTAVRLAGK